MKLLLLISNCLMVLGIHIVMPKSEIPEKYEALLKSDGSFIEYRPKTGPLECYLVNKTTSFYMDFTYDLVNHMNMQLIFNFSNILVTAKIQKIGSQTNMKLCKLNLQNHFNFQIFSFCRFDEKSNISLLASKKIRHKRQNIPKQSIPALNNKVLAKINLVGRANS